MNTGSSGRDLSGLRIDRASAPGKSSAQRTWMFVTLAVAVVGLLALFLYKLPTWGDTEPLVETYRVGYAGSGGSSSLLTASGYVVAQRQAAVSSKATGRLVSLAVEEGDQVRQGDLLGQVESADVEAERDRALANLEVARGVQGTSTARLKEARLSFERVEDLLGRKLASQAEYDRAEAVLAVAVAESTQAEASAEAGKAAVRAANVAVENTRIRAPFDGTVLTKEADVGEMVAPFGSAQSARGAVVTLADMSSLEVEADVSEANIERVRLGGPAQIVLDAYPAQRYRAKVKKIVPTADRAKATVLTKIAFLERDLRVLPEMSAKVTFLEEEAPSDGAPAELAVPRAAVVISGGDAYVFTLIDDLVRRKPVRLGQTQGDLQTIQSGLSEGDRVIVHPPQDLKDGDKVRLE